MEEGYLLGEEGQLLEDLVVVLLGWMVVTVKGWVYLRGLVRGVVDINVRGS